MVKPQVALGKVDDNVLTLYFKEMLGMKKQKDYKISMFAKDKFIYQSVKNKKDNICCDTNKIKQNNTIIILA